LWLRLSGLAQCFFPGAKFENYNPSGAKVGQVARVLREAETPDRGIS